MQSERDFSITLPPVSVATLSPKIPPGMSEKYISGVIEGFYGRPWTALQRRHLLRRLAALGFNTYVYAPKDDPLHRARWRDPYTKEEGAPIEALISYAKEIGIDFVYALSPGADIQYTKASDLKAVTDKLKQLRSMGCASFALLFDDIEPQLSPADHAMYGTPAIAQVSVTNDMFAALDCPSRFFFCPTEYCSSRAVPNVSESQYLRVIGDRLHPKIEVFWTVVPRYITPEHANAVARVLKRKPLIWDNLHANDYDMHRIFLGPFTGRSVRLREETSGLLLNPNCQLEGNFIPIETMAAWLSSETDESDEAAGTARDTPMEQGNTEGDTPVVYDHHQATEATVSKWLPSFNIGLEVQLQTKLETIKIDANSAEGRNGKYNDSLPTESSNSSLHESATMEHSPSSGQNDKKTLAPESQEPMDEERGEPLGSQKSDVSMTSTNRPFADVKWLRSNELLTLVHCFYTPFEHGESASSALGSLASLFRHASVMCTADGDERDPADESRGDMREWWLCHYEGFSTFANDIFAIYRCFTLHKALLVSSLAADLLNYISELYGSLTVSMAVLQWLKAGNRCDSIQSVPRRWERFEEGEPWHKWRPYTEDLHFILIPSATPALSHLFSAKHALPPSTANFAIRCIQQDDLAKISLDWLHRTAVTEDGNEMSPAPWPESSLQRFVDRFYRMFLNYSAAHCFLAEDRAVKASNPMLVSICGVLDVVPFVASLSNEFLPELRHEYATRATEDGCSKELIEKVLEDIDSWKPLIEGEGEAERQFPSYFDLRCKGDASDAAIARRLIQTLGTVLAHQGSPGIYTVIRAEEKAKQELLTSLRFVMLSPPADHGCLVLGLPLKALRSPSPSLCEDILEGETNTGEQGQWQ